MFTPIGSHVKGNEKKSLKLKNLKFLKRKKKKSLEIWWIATFPKHLALIRLTVSEKTRFTDGWMDGHPRHSISSADRGSTLVILQSNPQGAY